MCQTFFQLIHYHQSSRKQYHLFQYFQNQKFQWYWAAHKSFLIIATAAIQTRSSCSLLYDLQNYFKGTFSISNNGQSCNLIPHTHIQQYNVNYSDFNLLLDPLAVKFVAYGSTRLAFCLLLSSFTNISQQPYQNVFGNHIPLLGCLMQFVFDNNLTGLHVNFLNLKFICNYARKFSLKLK